MVKESEKCFVEENFHRTAKAKYCALSERLVRLNNYDHVTADLFTKLKHLLKAHDLSRFKKPALKICLACCKHLDDLTKDGEECDKKKRSQSLKPETPKIEDSSFDKLLMDIKTLPFDEEQLNVLMKAVGERLATLANKHVAQLNKSNLGNRLEHMASFNYQSYWTNAFGPLKNILLGLINGIRYVNVTNEEIYNLHRIYIFLKQRKNQTN